MTATADRAERSLVGLLLRNYRVMAQVLSVLLVVSLLVAGYILAVAQPALSRYIDMAYSSRTAQIALLEQSAAIRGWLVTGDESFLAEYAHTKERGDAGFDELVDDVSEQGTKGLTDAVVDTAVARSAWSTWADTVVTSALGGSTPTPDRVAQLHEGAALFEQYRQANEISTQMVLDRRTAALAASRSAMVLGITFFALALGTTVLLTMRQRRRIDSGVVGPLEDLQDTIARLREGDLGARLPPTGVVEVDRIGEALAGLASSLTDARAVASSREARLAYLADRFETIVRVGREIAGSLSVRYVSQTVTSAAADLLQAPTTLWVRGDDQQFHATSRSDDPHGVVPPLGLTAPESVVAAAADARPRGEGDGVRAYPLVLAGMVVGVLETGRSSIDADTDQVLEALLSTAAAALESASLHSAAKEVADIDALTRLPNRRRFEGDMEAEWDRCRRYGRPMCLVMIDLDHFKTLNDEHGHLFGDEVLRGASEALASALRTSDTAYRYGGEEFAVLLRETGLEDGREVADRIRQAISEATVPQHGVLVTASAGVAERLSTMAHHTELVAKADAALYSAKRDGRDRVATATD